MYSTSKLSNVSKLFIQDIPQLTKSNQEVVLFAVAKAISNELSLPSSPVENPVDFYTNTNFLNTRELLSVINELTVVDVDQVQELVKTFWLIRYNILYPRKKLFQTNQILSESHFFGYSSLLSPTATVFIQNNTALLIQLINGFVNVLCEVMCAETPSANTSGAY